MVGGIFYQDDHPDLGILGIKGHIFLIFEILDDGQKQAGIPPPDIGPVHGRNRLFTDILIDIAGIVKQKIKGQIGIQLFNLLSECIDIHSVQAGHGQNEVKMFSFKAVKGLVG